MHQCWEDEKEDGWAWLRVWWRGGVDAGAVEEDGRVAVVAAEFGRSFGLETWAVVQKEGGSAARGIGWVEAAGWRMLAWRGT